MASYDPQRNRTRARPSAEEPAPVDLLLGGALPAEPTAEPTEPPVVELQLVEEPAAEPGAHAHGPECAHDEHDHEHQDFVDLRPILAAAVATVAAAVVLVRRRRRRTN